MSETESQRTFSILTNISILNILHTNVEDGETVAQEVAQDERVAQEVRMGDINFWIGSHVTHVACVKFR